jgi:hypothetical protein
VLYTFSFDATLIFFDHSYRHTMLQIEERNQETLELVMVEQMVLHRTYYIIFASALCQSVMW